MQLRESLGLSTRLITGNSGEQDFCFLLKAKNEIIGDMQSSFFHWAGLLGETKKCHAYRVENPNTNSIDPSFFRNKDLGERFVFSTYVQNSTLDPNWRR